MADCNIAHVLTNRNATNILLRRRIPPKIVNIARAHVFAITCADLEGDQEGGQEGVLTHPHLWKMKNHKINIVKLVCVLIMLAIDDLIIRSRDVFINC